MAEDNNIKYQYKSYSHVNKLLSAVAENEVDVGIAGITRTDKREKYIDFSFYTLYTGLAIAISSKKKRVWKTLAEIFAASKATVARYFFLLLIVIAIFSHLMWFVERNTGAFSEDYLTGIFESAWWTLVTVASVGYGDIVPLTGGGRIVASITILVGFLIFSLLVAQLSSLLTIQKLRYRISSASDLAGMKVATQRGSAAVEELDNIGAYVTELKDLQESFRLLDQGKVDAVVSDEPVLKRLVRQKRNQAYVIVGGLFYLQSYGMAINSNNNDLRETINIGLLKLQNTQEFQDIQDRWFSGTNQ
ncbi:transporter substrate-binding domain-containing protein [Patescibacteria group bacterium]